MKKNAALYGLGFRAKHYQHIITRRPAIDFFEIITENYMDAVGAQRERLDDIRAIYPISLHGVSLSIGSVGDIDKDYLSRLKNFADEINPLFISDHLCWTGIKGINMHDLLPVPLTAESLLHITDKVKQVQDFLGRRLYLENPSSYLSFRADSIPEHEFISILAEKADCGLLLDVNNIYVSSFNHRLDARTYIDTIPLDRVCYVHLAGHKHMGNHIVDTHDSSVSSEVWDLYAYLLSKCRNISTMIEWDNNIPEFRTLEKELKRAKKSRAHGTVRSATLTPPQCASNHSLHELQENLQNSILEAESDGVETWVADKSGFPPHEQVRTYIIGYRIRIRDMLLEDYAELVKIIGMDEFIELAREYVNNIFSTHYDISRYSAQFAAWLQTQAISSKAKETALAEKLRHEDA